MLRDDIENGLSDGVHATKAFLGGGVRGLVMGAAIALLAGTVITAWPALVAAASFGEGLSAIAAASSVGMSWAGTGAIIGGISMAFASIIPGKEQGFGLNNLFRRRQPVQEEETVTAPPMQRGPDQSVTLSDNPYYEEGKGMRLMQRGDAAGQYVQR